jgi:hypothetical protein
MAPAQAPLPCSTGGPIASSALLAVFPQAAPAVGVGEFTRSSVTALQGGLVSEPAGPGAGDYLLPIKAAGKEPTPWLEAIARQVPALRNYGYGEGCWSRGLKRLLLDWNRV